MQAALNTSAYMGGSPYDKDGLDTYQVMGWAENAYLSSLSFIRTYGDAEKTRLEIFDRPYSREAVKLFEDILEPRATKVFNPSIELRNSRLSRIHVRLTALDGYSPNHCQIAFTGDPIKR